MARITKKDVYKMYGIEYQDGKILAPMFGFIPELLIDGNSKLGKGVWTWSTLAANILYEVNICGEKYIVPGTCPCNCNGCYAQTGFYKVPSTIVCNATKTILARKHIGFVRDAIIAQIKASHIKLLRIHASGDFFSSEYIEAWKEIVRECPDTLFWTYTKNPEAVNAFDEFENANIVKSVIPGYGFNFGHCDYILRVYEELKKLGKKVYICRCGIDKNQHCVNCRGCAENEIVLFIEHSTSYKAEKDVLFPKLKEIIEAQAKV